ncbi:histidine phosphatase family protein [Rathayibacter rathayi]|uniref:Histidine phosphatase family protein n=1 Tax=Rathayibacter rathayi TaxID=33887 RepID=A0ABX5AHE0_RATRA|nr:histidine phosphatase family protein [Rathayibacter rathayi]PPF25365.1 histidine phosphatase family protein [Rathayibacter rathayi]PPF50799.1 histidine phosphatase family protein [Rathayibacter rathayi]PPG96859.1 histidine phosphatase family protein [Rathayibacter rathayi]PPH68506.1 histidine phosphatase family protein [Rathayibacter rathayi]PPH79492.1 histidine phosphatase family protein [Rathayibacter rathayi]
MTQLTLVRHGQTDWNAARRIQGRSDIPLNAVGRSQARAAARLLRERHVDVVVASPLQRAFDTGAIIARSLGLAEPLAVPGLAERAYGEAEGMTGPEVDERFPGGLEHAPIPGRESRADVVERASAALLELAERFPDASVVVATHGAVIGSLIRALRSEDLPVHGISVGNGSRHDFAIVDGALQIVGVDDSGDVVVADVDLDDVLSSTVGA